jgi:hypothetical protein
MLVNPKQKIAVLASGLAIATTGFVVTDADASDAARAKNGSAIARAANLPAHETASGHAEAVPANE